MAESGRLAEKELYRTVPIGRIADHPVGGRVRIPGQGIEIESLPEGLRARLAGIGGGFVAIRNGSIGGLIADPNERWPEDRAYSVLINGPVPLDPECEETP